jgi:hypothetical protein
LSRNGKREGANIVATAVHIAGGPRRVAQALGVSRSQIYRWLAAGTMSHAVYMHVSGLARLSGIRTQFLGGEVFSYSDSSDSSPYVEGSVDSKPDKHSTKSSKLLMNPDTHSPVARLSQAGAKAALAGSVSHRKKNGFASIAIIDEPRGSGRRRNSESM